MVEAIKSDGGSATGFLLNAIEANSIEERVAAIEADIGPIEVVDYNLGAQIGDRALKDTSLKAFETGWRLGTFGLFRLASVVCPLMEARGKGTHPRDLSNRGDAWEWRSTFACGRHGRTSYEARSAPSSHSPALTARPHPRARGWLPCLQRLDQRRGDAVGGEGVLAE